jgi:hypothetical protein
VGVAGGKWKKVAQNACAIGIGAIPLPRNKSGIQAEYREIFLR